VKDYAQTHSYEFRNPSFSLLDHTEANATVHVTVSFPTGKSGAFEDHDALILMNKTSGTWQATPIQSFTKLDLEVTLDPGPLQLKSPAGFIVNIPAAFGGYIAPQSELVAAQQCGTGDTVSNAIPVLVVMPRGYSTQNVPVVMRAYQQCPRAPSLEAIRQRLDTLRQNEKALRFDRLEMIRLGGQQLLSVAVVDTTTGSVVYDFYMIYRGRQLEFVIQGYRGQDVQPLIDVMNGISFN
jgi:hypothetical protein